MGGVRPRRDLELRRHRPLRVARAAREPHGPADDPARLRWFLFTLDAANAPLALHRRAGRRAACGAACSCSSGMSFPSGRLDTRLDRALVIAGYLIFPLAFVPALLYAGPEELHCADCPDEPAADPARRRPRRDPHGLGALVTAGCSCVVLRRAAGALARTRRRSSGCSSRRSTCAACGTFLLVTAGRAGAGDVAWWAAFIATGLMPFAFLGGLLRSHVARPRRGAARRGWRSCARRARGWSRPATPSGAGSSATSTTARSRGSSRSR